MPSSDQKAVARYKVDEEVRKGLKEETVSEVCLKLVNASPYNYVTAVNSVVGGYRCSLHLKPRYPIL